MYEFTCVKLLLNGIKYLTNKIVNQIATCLVSILHGIQKIVDQLKTKLSTLSEIPTENYQTLLVCKQT